MPSDYTGSRAAACGIRRTLTRPADDLRRRNKFADFQDTVYPTEGEVTSLLLSGLAPLRGADGRQESPSV